MEREKFSMLSPFLKSKKIKELQIKKQEDQKKEDQWTPGKKSILEKAIQDSLRKKQDIGFGNVADSVQKQFDSPKYSFDEENLLIPISIFKEVIEETLHPDLRQIFYDEVNWD
jgi:hypothetical protein